MLPFYLPPMDPEAEGDYSRTAPVQLKPSTLHSLPLYDYNIWGGDLFEQFGPQSHARIQGRRQYQPQFLVPDESWWRVLARSITRRAYRGPDRLDHLSDPFPALEQLVHEHVRERGFFFGKYVPDSLPLRPSRTVARTIFYSALVIEYAIIGCYNMSDVTIVRHSLKVATSCFDAMLRPRCGLPHGPDSTAIKSAGIALEHLERKTATAEDAARKQACRQQQQGEVHRQPRTVAQRELQEQRLQRHHAASDKLHWDYRARQFITIWLRFQILRRRRAKHRALCAGASSRARTVRAASAIQAWYHRTAQCARLLQGAAYFTLLPAAARSVRISDARQRPAAPEQVGSTKKGNFTSLDRRDTRRGLMNSSTSERPKMSKWAKQLEKNNPLRDRGQQLPKRKRQQRNRRPRRRRPSKQFREEHPPPAPRQFGFPSGSRGARVGHTSRSASAADSRQDFSWPQAPDTATPSSLDSANLLVPNPSFPILPDDPIIVATTPMEAIEYHCDRERDPFRQKESLPLAIWGAQTIAAQFELNLGTAKPSATRLLLPASAASIIQRCYRRHCRHTIIRSAASRVQAWYRSVTHRTRKHAAASTIQVLFRSKRGIVVKGDRLLVQRIMAKLAEIESWDSDYSARYLCLHRGCLRRHLSGTASTLQFLSLRRSLDVLSQSIDGHFTRQSAANCIQRCYRHHRCQVLANEAASYLQVWIRRTNRRVLLQGFSEALQFQRQSTWEQWATDAVEEIAKVLHRQRDKLSDDFILKASTTWLLPLIEREFPGIDSAYNLVPVSSLRARAYSMTAEYLSWFAIEWTKSGRYESSFTATICRLAKLFLETASSLPTSSDLNLSTDFSWAQHRIDEAHLDSVLGPQLARSEEFIFDSTLDQQYALASTADATFDDESVLAEESVLDDITQLEHVAATPSELEEAATAIQRGYRASICERQLYAKISQLEHFAVNSADQYSRLIATFQADIARRQMGMCNILGTLGDMNEFESLSSTLDEYLASHAIKYEY